MSHPKRYIISWVERVPGGSRLYSDTKAKPIGTYSTKVVLSLMRQVASSGEKAVLITGRGEVLVFSPETRLREL